MSFDTVLARKWRPHQFSEVVGQEPVVRALSQALTSGRLHHAYLFTGTRGVGKTTLARIFAKALNCRDGMTAEPCHDDISQAIDAGRFVDLIEIDAASRTKVEDTRELLDNVQYAPTVGRYKIYLIDEVHMLSTHSFNALLKTLEEPPEHVKFLLATTDPHKLPVTILSRCLQFHLRPMTPEVLHAHLAKVLTAEGITFESTALDLVVRMSGGSVRDALSLLDQAIMLGSGAVHYAATRDMLGLASDDQVNAAIAALAQSDSTALLTLLREWIEWGADFDRLQQQLLEKLHQLALVQSFPALAEAYDTQLVALAERVSSEQVQLWLQVALLAQDDMRLAPTAQMGFELMLMRLLHFRPTTMQTTKTASAPKPVSARSATTDMTTTSMQAREPASAAFVATTTASSSTKAAEDTPHLAALAALGIQKKTAAPAEKKTVEFADTLVIPPEAPVDSASPATDASLNRHPWSLQDWQACIEKWQLKGAELSAALHCVRLVSDNENEVRLAYAPDDASKVRYFEAKLIQAITQAAPNAVVIWESVWHPSWLTPQGHVQAQAAQQESDIKAQIMADARLQVLNKQFGLTANWSQLSQLTNDLNA